MGGAGSAVFEVINKHCLTCSGLQLGLPDEYTNHAKPDAMLKHVGLDSDGILKAIQQRIGE
jgi:1-deoxy-D-xylulose-5-phosphate synthase